MAEHPVLVFPSPQLTARGTAGRFIPPSFSFPGATRQVVRLSPQFAELEANFTQQGVEVQHSSVGIDPERVLVIETIGSVQDFVTAVRHIDGWGWLGEFDVGDVEPDEDFHYDNEVTKKIQARLYLVMTNRTGLQQLLSLWTRYSADSQIRFARGKAKFRALFQQLKTIRYWGVEDRLIETGLLGDWRLELNGNSVREQIPFEVELWFHQKEEDRERSQETISDRIRQAGGRVITSPVVIPEVAYHGLLAELPRLEIERIISSPDTKLVKCEQVMFFRHIGQMVADPVPAEEEILEDNSGTEFTASGSLRTIAEPIVALFDGMPLSNHRLLQNRLRIDDPDEYGDDYPAVSRGHGTSMASLIIHGDRNTPQPSLGRQIYVRPIMKVRRGLSGSGGTVEEVPENCLLIDLVHRSVVRLFETGQAGSIAPTIKIINLSIANRYCQFIREMSPLARLIDWLSEKYKVLFIVSAGNHESTIRLDLSPVQFRCLSPEELSARILQALYRNLRNRRLLSPAETINGITVGSLHDDQSPPPRVVDDLINPFGQLLPSPFSAFGGGYCRAIKPDLVHPGGKMFYKKASSGPNFVELVAAFGCSRAPGNKVAAPGSQDGDTAREVFSCGTSNATALTTRMAAFCHDELLDIFSSQSSGDSFSPYLAVLIKATLIHGCSWEDVAQRLSSVFSDIADQAGGGRTIREITSRWIGYGIPNFERVFSCTPQRVTVLGCGELSHNQAHVFRFPLPVALSARPDLRRLTVTLSWFSPVEPSCQKYRTAKLWFEVTGNRIASDRKDAEWRSVRKGTIQHEVFEGRRAELVGQGEFIEIKVNCQEDAGRIRTPIGYGLVVSLEVLGEVGIDIYNEIRTGIQTQSRIRI